MRSREVGVLRRCLKRDLRPQDTEDGRDWCVYKHNPIDPTKILQPQPKGWPKRYLTEDEAKRGLEMMHYYKSAGAPSDVSGPAPVPASTGGEYPLRIREQMLLLLRHAARYTVAAEQDENAMIRMLHANYGAGFLFALEALFTDVEIKRELGVDVRDIHHVIIQEQDRAQVRLAQECPDLVPAGPLARMGRELLLGDEFGTVGGDAPGPHEVAAKRLKPLDEFTRSPQGLGRAVRRILFVAYDILPEDLNTWTAGACWVAAEAISRWLGPAFSRPVALWGHPRKGAAMGIQHVVAEVEIPQGRRYLDGDGYSTSATLLRRWREVEGVQDPYLGELDLHRAQQDCGWDTAVAVEVADRLQALGRPQDWGLVPLSTTMAVGSVGSIKPGDPLWRPERKTPRLPAAVSKEARRLGFRVKYDVPDPFLLGSTRKYGLVWGGRVAASFDWPQQVANYLRIVDAQRRLWPGA